jgi:CO/xanthine dehydrogenase Mo-binding subunit
MSAGSASSVTNPSLRANPILARWIGFDAATRQVELRVGKVEIGQGITTALRQIAADALALEPQQIKVVAGHTTHTPDELWTSASISVEVGGDAVRQVCREVRALFAAAAAGSAGATASTPCKGAAPDYWALAATVDLQRALGAGAALPQAGVERRHVGQSVQRLDLVDKLQGRGFVHDLTVPGMWHARVLRPPRQGSSARHVDRDALLALPGVLAVCVDGNFVAVAGDDEWAVVQAQAHGAPCVLWAGGQPWPDPAKLEPFLRGLPTLPRVVHDTQAADSLRDEPAGALRASYIRPYVAHASVGTCCALATLEGDQLVVHSHSQGVFPLRDAIARALGRSRDSVTVIHRDGAGCYGHNGADDAAFEAALLAHTLQRPVRLAWSRAEELSWAPFGPAMLVDIDAAIAADGRVTRWQHEVTSTTHLVRPGWGDGVNLLSAAQLAQPHAPSAIADPPQQPFGGGGDRNAIPLYAFANLRVDYRFSPATPLRTSAFRSLGAQANVFAIESMLDELAAAAGLDPLTVRLANLQDERARGVLLAAVRAAGWQPGRDGTGDWGWGLGFAQYKNRAAYFAAVVQVSLSHVVRVRAVHAAVDCGLAVNPDGVRNQIEGGILQAISLSLKEQVRCSEAGLATTNWDDYPILRFDEVPALHIELLPRDEWPSLGVGECTLGPIAAAIANAVHHAIGIRVRQLPITVESIVGS